MKMNVFYDFSEIICCIYAVVKNISKRNSSKHDPENFSHFEVIYEISYIVISLLIFVISAFLLLPFVIIRIIIDAYLKWKYGEKYGGLLKHMDALWTGETAEAKHIVNGLLFMELKKSPDEFIACLKQSIKKSGDIRFNSTVRSVLNYKYRLQSDEIVDEVVRSIPLTSDEKSNKSKFEEKFSNLANQFLPSASSFELLLCDEPITFNNCDGEQINNRKHVVIFRLHHSTGDGLSLLAYMLKLSNQTHTFMEVTRNLTPNNVESNVFRKKEYQESENTCTTYLNQLIQKIKATSLYHFDLLAPADKNILHGPTLTGKKIIIFDTDHESKYISKIKSIKGQSKDCRFVDVLYTAISASLFEHFYQHSQNVPKNINMSFIVACPRRRANENEETEHAFSAVTLDIPLHIDGTKSADENLMLRLETIKARRKILQHSVDSLLFYWISRYVSLFPTPLLRIACKLGMKNTISFSNLPGVQSAEFGGEKVENIVFCAPNVADMGIGLSAHTYAGCLQIGLMADKILLPNSEQASTILQNVYKYIDLLDKEINSKK